MVVISGGYWLFYPKYNLINHTVVKCVQGKQLDFCINETQISTKYLPKLE